MFDGQDDNQPNNVDQDGANGAQMQDHEAMEGQQENAAQEQDGFIMLNNPGQQVNQEGDDEADGGNNVPGAKPEFGPLASKMLAPSIGGAVAHPAVQNAGANIPQNFNTHV